MIPRRQGTRTGPRLRGGVAVALLGALGLAGPHPSHAGLNQWTSNGPPSTSIRALAADPLTSGPVYAGTNGLGMFGSEDGGVTWKSINQGLTNPVINAVAINPQVSSTLYVGTNGGGVFTSANKGNGWTSVNDGLGNPLVAALAIDPQTPATLYAGTTGGGVFRTTTGGASWAPVNTGLANTLVTALAINPQITTTVYAGTSGGGVFKSVNGGASWAPASTGLATTLVRALAIDPRAPATLFAGTNGGGVFLSVDGAASWTPFNQGLSDPVVNALAVTLFGTCAHAGTVGSGVFDLATALGSCGRSPLAAAVLPSSRSVLIGGTATAFATILNSGPGTGVACGIAAPGNLGEFLFQTTDPATNRLIGTPNTAVDINAGSAGQTFLIAFTPVVGFAATDVPLAFGCANTPLAPVISGVNSLLLSASPTPVPDVVALAATTTDDGIVDIPGVNGTGAFSVATANVGAGGSITATTDTGVAALPVRILLCETDARGNCLVTAAPTVTRTIDPGQTPTYGVFVTGTGTVGFNPSLNRIFVRFRDAGGAVRGSTSVAVRTQ